jgi:hypothetical protein
MVGLEIDECSAGLEVDNPQAPGSALIDVFMENRFDLRRDACVAGNVLSPSRANP